MGKRKRNHVLKLLKSKQDIETNPILENENSVALKTMVATENIPSDNLVTLEEPPFETALPKKKTRKPPTKKTTAKKTTTRRKKKTSSK